jgi:hypothetical protein
MFFFERLEPLYGASQVGSFGRRKTCDKVP